MRYRLATGLVGALVLVASVSAQDPAAANKEAMKKLAFLAGKWAGDATVTLGPDGKKTIKQTENVQLKLAGTVLLVEGTGRGKLPGKDEEGIVFNALAILSYDATTKKYGMKAHTMEGRSTDAELTLTEKGFNWGFKEPQRGMQVRYTMTLTEKGEWHEFGEYSPDGKAWTKFIEMTLTKVKE